MNCISITSFEYKYDTMHNAKRRIFSFMKIYLYHKCSTCKNALRFIESHNLKATVIEITKQPPSREELKAMLNMQNGQLRKLFNTSGLLYKEMQLSEKLDSMPLDQALELLHSNGMLVKRPFLLAKDFGLLGFREQEWVKKLT
jgi:arsenate reductase